MMYTHHPQNLASRHRRSHAPYLHHFPFINLELNPHYQHYHEKYSCPFQKNEFSSSLGYYLLCPMTLFLSLQQIKQICCFVCLHYYVQGTSCSKTLESPRSPEQQIEQDLIEDSKPVKKVIKKRISK